MSLLDTASLVITPNGTKAGTLYSVVPSSGAGDMTVTRATTATRVNSAGLIESVASNVPRLDYTNGTCPSILVEPQRTNLFTYSQDFSNSDWDKIDIQTVTTGITDPANGTTGVRIIPFTGFNGIVTRTITTTIGTPYTVTIWIKGTANGTVNFNHGGISLAPQNNISYTTQWQKFQYNFTADSVTSQILIGGFFSWSAGQNIDFTFAQIEAGSYATSYIPTTSASVTRNADSIYRGGISSLIGQTEGTLFIDFYHDGLHSYFPCAINNGSYDDAIYLDFGGNYSSAVIFNSGSLEFGFNAGTLSVGRHKVAIGYKTNDTVYYIDGVLKHSDTSLTIPDCSRFDIGFVGGGSIEKTVANSLALWKTRLTNTQLAQLTTI